MQSEHYNIKLEGFEGPFDLLLNLIEKRKLFINDISLSKVTDDYIAHIKNIESFPIAQSANFILVASTLLLIKSKSLLPALTLSTEEETSIEELERRLKIYKRMKELSRHIVERFGSTILFPPESGRPVVPVFSPDKNTTLPGILTAVRGIIASIPKVEKIPKAILKKVVSLEETIKLLTERITTSLKMSFKDFANHKGENNATLSREDKIGVIVSFLAMLELVKQGIINVTQNKLFHDIDMETNNVGVPRY